MITALIPYAVAAANEGIPVAAIARILKHPMDDLYEVLKDQKAIGSIVDIPRADWPPGTRVAARVPELAVPSDEDLSFSCKRTFKLTALEVGFLVALLKNKQVEKSRLHHVVEQQRATRQSQPDKQDETDPKMVDVIICKLRKKLKTVDRELKIETIWGGGYCIASDMKPRIIAVAYGEPHAQEAAPAPANDNEPRVPTGGAGLDLSALQVLRARGTY